jgi:hypothetical protein
MSLLTAFGAVATPPSLTSVLLTPTPPASYQSSTPQQILRNQEKAKKKKYIIAPCLERRRHFTPLVFSVDDLRGPEATAAAKQLAKLLSRKWGRAYSQCCQFVWSRLSIALARGTTMCLRGQRDHGLRHRNYNWADGDGGLPLYMQ